MKGNALNMYETKVKIDGMMCGMCESHINDTIRKAAPVKKVTSSHAKGEAVVLTDEPLDIEAVKAAEDKKYVLMNVPTDRLKEITEVLPGIKSPTIMPLATEGWSSVHTVLDQKCFWEIIGKLKALGAQGILVLPIEKMIL